MVFHVYKNMSLGVIVRKVFSSFFVVKFYPDSCDEHRSLLEKLFRDGSLENSKKSPCTIRYVQ